MRLHCLAGPIRSLTSIDSGFKVGYPAIFVGDAQGVSNISAPNSVKIYEAWLQKNFSRNQVSVLAGLGRVERFAVLDAESMVGGVLRLVGVARRALRRVDGVGFFMMLVLCGERVGHET